VIASALFVTGALIAFTPLTLALVGTLAGYCVIYGAAPLVLVRSPTPHAARRRVHLSQGGTQ
jgi:hypothetical protein